MSHHVVKYSFSLGNYITKAIERAKELTKNYETVEFDFNGIKCVVNKDTNPEYLERDYMNAHIMGWKQVGPVCQTSYDADTEADLCVRKLAQEKRQKEEQMEYDKKCKADKEVFSEKVAGIEMEFKDEAAWIDGRERNTDPYGACIYEYAEGWAKLMQKELANGSRIIDCAERTSFELEFLGITGFMYGAAVSVLSQCWKYGEELRKWHNKEYNHDGDGVVNPAILTISTKD